MTDEELKKLIVRRYSAAQSPVGPVAEQLCPLEAAFWRGIVLGAAGFKRLFDVIASAVLLVMCAPVFLILAALVKAEDGGPVFSPNAAWAGGGREFQMLKFRTMCPEAEEQLPTLLARNQQREGVTFKNRNDPRLTRVGRWMRKYSLDELPQFINVLRGEMSLVGPRPPLPREVALYALADRRRLSVKPGITCLWQISGRTEIDFSGQVRLDVQYIESQNFWNDVKILLRTVPAVLSGRGAC